MNPVKSLREIIETKLKEKKISTLDFTKKIGIALTYFSEILSGERIPTEEQLQKIAHFLSLNAHEKNELLTIAALQKTPEFIVADYIKKSAMLEIIKRGIFEIPEVSDSNMKSIYSVKVDISNFVYEYVEEELKIKLDKMRDNFLIVEIIRDVLPFLVKRREKKEDSNEEEVTETEKAEEEERIDILPKINIYDNIEIKGEGEIFKEIKEVFIMPHLENHGDLFGIRVFENGMEPIIEHNSVVIIRKSLNVNDGNIALVRHNNQVLLRYIRKNGNSLFLMGANPECLPILVQNRQELKIIGKVIKIIKDVK